MTLNVWSSTRKKGPGPRAHDNHLYSNLENSPAEKLETPELRVWYTEPLFSERLVHSPLAIRPYLSGADLDARETSGRQVDAVIRAAESFGWNITYIISPTDVSKLRSTSCD